MYLDVSYPFWQGMAIYPNNPSYGIERTQMLEHGDGANVSKITLGTHTGTHIDAPCHFLQDGKTVDEIPLERMNGAGRVLDLTGRDRITVEDLEKQKIKEDEILLFKTDNSARYAGVNILSEHVSPDYGAARYLAEKKIRMVGTDYMTIERPRAMRESGQSVHKTLLRAGIVILEALDLRVVPAGEYVVHCFPLRLAGADGAPARVVLEEGR